MRKTVMRRINQFMWRAIAKKQAAGNQYRADVMMMNMHRDREVLKRGWKATPWNDRGGLYR